MSVHKSLKSSGALARSRNVLTRYERILELERQGKFGDEDSPFGLPKVRVMKVKHRGKKKKDDDAGDDKKDEAAAAPAAPDS